MDVNNVGNVNAGAVSYTAPPPNDAGQVVNVTEAPKSEAAVYEQSQQVYKPDYNTIKQIWSEHEQKMESFRKLVEALLNKQAQKYDLATDILGRPIWKGDEIIEIDEETRAAMQAEIDEGGYFSVEEVAKRLLNFAVALSGGDPSKIELLRDAVMQGFADAEQMWGGKLPEISYQTLDAVMKGFDEWKEAGNANAISILKPKAAA